MTEETFRGRSAVEYVNFLLSTHEFRYETNTGANIEALQAPRMLQYLETCDTERTFVRNRLYIKLSALANRSHITKEEGEVSYVSCRYPIFFRDLTQDECAFLALHPSLALGAFIHKFGDAIISLSDDDDDKIRSSSVYISRAISEYRYENLAFDTIRPIIDECIRSVRSNISSANQTIANIVEKSGKIESDIKSKTSDIDNFFKTCSERLEATNNATIAKLVLEEPIITWRRKANSHTIAFWLSTILLTVLSAGTVFASWYMANEMRDLLIEIAKANPLAVTALLAIPLIAIFMVLRIIARLVTSNLALAHDARQRRALADMYLRLVSNADAGMDNESRRIALSALFRAAPGQPIDEPVNHPAFEIFNSK